MTWTSRLLSGELVLLLLTSRWHSVLKSITVEEVCLDEKYEYNAPVSVLPVEVISRIFELATHEKQAFVLAISSVCRYWRAVSFKTPKLWTHIALDWYRKTKNRRVLATRIRSHVERTGALPIIVDLDFQHVKSLRDAVMVMDILRPHLTRCYSFRAVVPDWTCMNVVAKDCGNMRETLESITLQINQDANGSATRVVVLSGSFPRLKSVTLVRTPPSCIFAKASTPCLRKFHLLRNRWYSQYDRLHMSLQEYCSALTASSVLEDVCLESTELHFGRRLWDFSDPEHIPAVRVLRLSFVGHYHANIIFVTAVLPSLVRLEIQTSSDYIRPDITDVVTFPGAVCTGRMKSLRHLVVRGCPTSGVRLERLGTMLSHLPELTALEFMDSPVPLGVFCMLASQSLDNPRMLPNLRFFTVSGCKADSGPEIVNMVRTRARIPRMAQLEELRVFAYSCLDPEVVVDLREYLGDNLKILQSEAKLVKQDLVIA